MDIIISILFLFLLICAIAMSFTKNTLAAVIIFGAFSLAMSVIWIIMESPDLAITEAAVGAGVTGILFYATLKRIDQIDLNAATMTGTTTKKLKGNSHEKRKRK
ncbi:MAG: DUF4040 domain-containing protein [Lachnospiraceae bacterium]|nr:DUF4040 domain-containing protein [Lachnospiraceae bacterium]MBR4145578.1 DUF4040 domain-containing protein [Lachnospiraceae bacterium]MBR4781795.1 DUF4040 domain-containing protein [Lachnospiraceae bacterium]MBR6473897.1 DUF4040 domain-containing protein [Lachnospiraceae bacterium]